MDASERLSAPCEGDTCVTCSDSAVKARLVALTGPALAVVDVGGTLEEVSVALVEAQVGDYVLVHAKEALGVVDERDSEPHGADTVRDSSTAPS